MKPARERILDAAVERIASDGIDAVRIARIAMDARVSTALVHYHFATREALLAEALEHSFETAGATRTEAGEAGVETAGATRTEAGEAGVETAGATRDVRGEPADPVERLRAMVEQCLPLPGEQERDWVLWVELWLRAVRHPELRPTAARLYARMHAWLLEAIEELGADDPATIADRTLALIDGYGVRALLDDPAVPLERAREEVWSSLARDLGLEYVS